MPMTEHPTPVINPVRLAALSRGDASKLHALIKLFIEVADSDIVKVRHAVANRDSKSVKHAIHSIRAAAATIGASHVALTSEQIELASGQGDWPQIEALLQRFLVEFENVRTYLNSLQALPLV